MYYPTQCSGGADPGNTCQNQPQNTDNYPSVVNLPYSRDQKAQQAGYEWFAHLKSPPIDDTSMPIRGFQNFLFF
jgi:hypothetical protein